MEGKDILIKSTGWEYKQDIPKISQNQNLFYLNRYQLRLSKV